MTTARPSSARSEGLERSRGTGDESGSQTLSRGIRILEFLADHGVPATIPEIVAGVDLHRSIAYRLLRTLEQHRLVTRDERGLVGLGPRLATLAASVDRDVQSAALPALRAAAGDLGATCFLVTLDHDEVITLVSVEPARSRVTVAEHPGTKHPLGVGAPGRAVLAAMPEHRWPATLSEAQLAEAREAKATGFAVSFSEVIPGLRAVAVPLRLRDHVPMAVAVVYVSTEHGVEDLAGRLRTASEEIAASMGA